MDAVLSEALAHHRAGRLDRAAALYERVLAARPNHADALHLLGLIAHQRGDQTRARDLIARALRRQPDNPVFLNNLASVLLAQREPQAACALLERAVRAKPDYADALNNLGNAQMQLGRAEGALAAYDDALTLRPDDPQTLNNLGSALKALGRLADAEASFAHAIARAPNYATAHANHGLVLHAMGHYDAAAAAYERALAIEPDHATARANRAVLLLLRGDFESGWREYAWRWRVDGFTTPRRAFDQPQWDGAPLDGRTIFLHAEQGIGSAIQFVRYVDKVAAAGGRIVLECQPPLGRLFTQSFAGGPVEAVVVKGEAPSAFDVHLPLMSLPERCRTTLATIPARVPYLVADANACARWQRRLAIAPRPRVGLVWAGNPRHANDRNRSAPADVFAPLIGLGGTLYSLQVGAEQGVAAFAAGAVTDLAPELTDFAETAAALTALDLVISVDTAVAHLAGALGVAVWLLLPFAPEWRWLLDREDSPWYPTMRLFRQRAAGDWADLIDRVRWALAGLAGR